VRRRFRERTVGRVKVLVLGNSNDTGSFVPETAKRNVRIAELLTVEFGEPVEVAARNAWPNDRMVDFVLKSVADVRPDLVYVNVTTYPFAYESTPLRVRRVFRRVGGEKIGDAGLRLADNRRWSHNAAFRAGRRLARLAIGGDTHFTPEEVAERYERLIRALLREEGLVVAVNGPNGRTGEQTRRAAARAEARRQVVHQRLKALCHQLHVFYKGSDLPKYAFEPDRPGTTVGDGLHSNAEGHRLRADEKFVHLRDAWREHLEQSGEARV